LARTTLEDDKVTDADKVAWDGYFIRSRGFATGRNHAAAIPCTCADARGAINVNVNVNVHLSTVMMVKWMQDAFCCTLDATAEGVVITLVVVVPHLAFSADVYVNVFSSEVFVACWSTTLVFDVDEVGIGAAAVLSFSDVNLCLSVLLITSLTALVLEVDRVSRSAKVDVNVNVGLSWTTIVLPAKIGLCETFTLLVDTDLCLIAAWTFRISDPDVDVFPSDARGATGLVEFPLYLCCGNLLCGSVTPVRRREDTNRDGDTGVKVQFDWLWGALTLEYLSIVER